MPRLTKNDYELLAALRHTLRLFLSFSQKEARKAGLTPQQHQAMLVIKGFSDRDHTSVSELADRLQLRHHSVVGLVDRLVRRGMLRRTPSRGDRRRVELHLTARGESLLERLSVVHLAELRQRGKDLHRVIGSLTRI